MASDRDLARCHGDHGALTVSQDDSGDRVTIAADGDRHKDPPLISER